jgi:hypothetical protein
LLRLAGVNGRIPTNSTARSPGSFISTKFGSIGWAACSRWAVCATSLATVQRSSLL